MQPLSVILFASGPFAVPVVRALAAAPASDIVCRALVTKPDPVVRSRGRKPAPCPAKTAMLEAGGIVLAPPSVNDPAFVQSLRDPSAPPDVFVVVDFGQFLKPDLLSVPRLGSVNVHPSLLPRWRGASPVQWALANGDAETGVSVLYVTAKMDAGDILARETAPILPSDTAETLAPRLAERGAALLLGVLRRLRDGTASAVPQDPALATFAHVLERRDGIVDWTAPASVVVNRWRGFHPWPGALAALPDGTLLKIHAMRPEPLPDSCTALPAPAPGTVAACGPDGPLVACGGATAVRLLSVQPAGKPAMSGAALLCGRRLRTGDLLPVPSL